MIYPLARIKKIITRPLVFLIALLCTTSIWGTQIPERPNPERLVNDMANMLSAYEERALEQNLVQFNNSTTTQIVVVTTPTLNGMDKAMYATELGHKWGVGQANKDNGIVLLVKEKTATDRGDVFIAVGYGLEGVIPDAIAKRIVENEIIPRFKQGDYYGGITQAVTRLQQLALGEFTASEYQAYTNKQKKNSPGGIIIPILLFLFFFGNIFGRASRVRRNSLGRGLSFWMLLSLLSSGSRSSSGGFGNFSSGSGSFGGFGGGGFGGGGAGGSW